MSERYATVEVAAREQWRSWLTRHHAESPGVQVVTWKKGRGPYLAYGDLVEEALCFGWIDSQARRVDDDRTSLLMTPRRTRSAWSASNRERVGRLLADGLMTPAGLAAVEAARQDGRWTS